MNAPIGLQAEDTLRLLTISSSMVLDLKLKIVMVTRPYIGQPSMVKTV